MFVFVFKEKWKTNFPGTRLWPKTQRVFPTKKWGSPHVPLQLWFNTLNSTTEKRAPRTETANTIEQNSEVNKCKLFPLFTARAAMLVKRWAEQLWEWRTEWPVALLRHVCATDAVQLQQFTSVSPNVHMLHQHSECEGCLFYTDIRREEVSSFSFKPLSVWHKQTFGLGLTVDWTRLWSGPSLVHTGTLTNLPVSQSFRSNLKKKKVKSGKLHIFIWPKKVFFTFARLLMLD